MEEVRIKKGFNVSKEFRPKNFTTISIEGDFHYCKSHKFVYNREDEERKLYNGEPCIYTDKRFDTESVGCNFYKRAYLYQNGRIKTNKSRVKRKNSYKFGKGLSLEACISRVKKIKGIPKGTIVSFSVNWFYPGHRGLDTSFNYVENRKDTYIPDYQITRDCYCNNFNNDIRGKDLIDFLRLNGFIIKVWNENPHRLIGTEEGESCIGYGFGRMFGFASNKNKLFGYSDTAGKISMDLYGEFDKWSKCTYRISKDKTNQEILEFLTQKIEDNG